MKTLFRTAFAAVLLGLAAFPAKATFTSMYVFGDALSTTTNNNSGLTQLYYGKRYSNGRVWVEVLAQRQGIPIANNWSYFDDDSSNLIANVKNFNVSIPPTALVVVWCNNSDLFDQAFNGTAGQWTSAIGQAQLNESNAIVQLYNKGARTLLMPSAVDLSEVPDFDLDYTPAYLGTIHSNCLAYNVAFSNMLNQVHAAHANFTNLTIIEPDFFNLLNNVLTNAPAYGLTNALSQGENIDAIDALGKTANTNGFGANYIYWDYLDPSARFHEVIADDVQQIIAPVQIDSLSILGNPARSTLNMLGITNMPVGLNGFVYGLTSTNGGGSTGWIPVTGFNSTNPLQSISFNAPALPPVFLVSGNGPINPGSPGSSGNSGNGAGTTQTNTPTGAMQSYRLQFPYNWTWP